MVSTSSPIIRTLLWPKASLPVSLPAEEVHLWAWTFDLGGVPSDRDLEILDLRERQRTRRFRFPIDQVRFAVCHANMRRILASYLACPPVSLVFGEDAGGKPFLAQDASGLRFNLSHSKTLAVLAVAFDMEVGIDVEDVRPIEIDVAKRFFSTREVASLSSLEGSESWSAWLDGFYRCWTRKEAILKAEGAGLRTPLDSFDVSLLPDEPAALLDARPEAKLTSSWHLVHLSPAAGVIGALAVAEVSASISQFAYVS
jgi:4'-phosphopantetheinyl transferase